MLNRDTLPRAALLLIDLKRAATIDEALATLKRYRLVVAIGRDAVQTESGQACLLTIVNTAARTCVGGVFVLGVEANDPLLTLLGTGHTLVHTVRQLGGNVGGDVPQDVPGILIGDYRGHMNGTPVLRATYGGWSGGFSSGLDGFRLQEDSSFPPAAIFAGALAVSECFAYLVGGNVLAGYRSMGLSLLDLTCDWRTPCVTPELYLPSALWMLGLGHLGQAYAWTLASLPYPKCQKAQVILNDFDLAKPANVSTSVLTHHRHVYRLKTRTVARWLERRGFQTRLIERPFTEHFRRSHDEPNILLCGVDNLPTRRLLERPGFSFVVDAGLGASAPDYDGFFVQTFTNTGRAETAFPESARALTRQDRVANNQTAYDSLGLDECGMHWAADIVVGVPFVGVAVSCLVIAEVIRAIGGAALFDTLAGSLRNVNMITAYSAGTTIRNPGYICPHGVRL